MDPLRQGLQHPSKNHGLTYTAQVLVRPRWHLRDDAFKVPVTYVEMNLGRRIYRCWVARYRPYRFWSCRAASCSSVPATVSLKHEFLQGQKVNHPLGQLKELLFAFTSSSQCYNVHRRPTKSYMTEICGHNLGRIFLHTAVSFS